jgi:uncharacterized protein
MKTRLIIVYAFLVGCIMLLIILGGHMFPKYAGRMIGFGLFLFVDIVCWNIFRKYSYGNKLLLKRTLNILYWVPLSLFVLILAAGLVFPIQNWNAFFRIYLPGILVVTFIWKLILILFLLIGEIIALLVNLGKRVFRIGKNKIAYLRFRLFISLGLISGGISAVLLFSGFFFWVYDFKVHAIEINVKNLPDDLDGFRIVQLSDIHLGSWLSDKPLLRAIDKVNALNPNVICFTGDLVNFTTAEAYPFEDALQKLKAPSGEFAILGNHDYGDYVKWDTQAEHDKNNADLELFYQKLGWKLLKNDHALIHKGKDSLALLGVENWSANKIWGKKGDLKKAYAGVKSVQIKILLSHDPTHWDKEVLPSYPDILLTLSGHTHAMQMGWELGRYRWSPAKWIFPRWGGEYAVQGEGNTQYLNVNRGLGHLGFPGRIGIRPEITLIILRKATNQ